MTWKHISRTDVYKLLARDLSREQFDKATQGLEFLTNTDMRAKIASVSPELRTVFEQVQTKAIQPLFIGSMICDAKKRKGRVSLSFAEKLSVNEPVVVLHPNAEQLFLYGRDIWSNSIKEVKGSIKEGDLLYVKNRDDLFLGMGLALKDDLLERGDQRVIKNVLDNGFYLRVEKH